MLGRLWNGLKAALALLFMHAIVYPFALRKYAVTHPTWPLDRVVTAAAVETAVWGIPVVAPLALTVLLDSLSGGTVLSVLERLR